MPVFTSGTDGHTAELYVYYPSVDFMVKLETTAAPDVFTDVEFAYLVGEFHSVVTEFLTSAWYSDLDEVTMASVAQQLEDDAKPMRQPFQRPGASLAVGLDSSGIIFTYAGQAADGAAEVSFSAKMTWAEVMAQQ